MGLITSTLKYGGIFLAGYVVATTYHKCPTQDPSYQQWMKSSPEKKLECLQDDSPEDKIGDWWKETRELGKDLADKLKETEIYKRISP